MAETINGGKSITGLDYTKLFAQAPAPIAIYQGKELRYSFVNEAYAKIFNFRSLLGKTVREAFPELEGQPFFKILDNVYETGIPYHGIENPALIDLNNDGILSTRYYNLVYTPYTNDEGIIEGVMAFGHDVTDQVEARKKDRESDLRFRQIVEQSSVPILILKGEDLLLDVANEALFKLWNIGKEMIGKPLLEILPEMKDQPFHDLLLEVYNNGISHYGQETKTYFKRKNGEVETHYFNFSYQPYREENEKISGVLVVATDVTEQVQAKAKLKQSQINFENLIMQAPVAMCVLRGPEFILEIANAPVYEIWGKGPGELLGKPIFEGLTDAKGQGLEEIINKVYETGERFTAYELPVQLPRNSGTETVYLNFVYEALHDEEGKINGIIAVATDVTEQVQARHKIEYAEESATLAIESGDLGTYEVNLLNDEMITSPRFKAIWGVDEQAPDRASLASMIHPDDLPVRDRAHKKANETGKLHYEARILCNDGNYKWVKINGKVLFDEKHKPKRLLGVIQDITEQKTFAEELSKQVEDQTRDLVEANERLERSNEDLEQFAYVASHDLQEPLRKIKFFNSLVLENENLGDESRRYIEKVSHAADRMTGLIRDLLEYSRLSQKNFQFERTDLNVIFNNILSDFELLISQKNGKVEAGLLPTLDAIPLQMNQLFYNLIGNALKFSKRGVPPIITVSANQLTKEKIKGFPELNIENEYFEIRFSDNGMGFNQQYADKIFTIFQRLNEKSVYGGYGIGLALCRKIINNHSGIIYAEGRPGEGATFIFILPCKQQ